MYGADSAFLGELFLLLAVVVLLMLIFNAVMRKWLGVEKAKVFSYNHANDTHAKIDWTIRWIGIVMLIVGYIITIIRLPQEPILFLQPFVLIVIFGFASGVVQAVMEWKYAKNPRAYILTASQLVFFTFLLVSLYATDFWGIA
ncbi:DUF4181 domain-containing protein [Planococcus lenghuensis]|uniref:DUF4181 domain-containing protein n=1 Tax=Planococcus lenghuensis TaxID=2213202 RepID=A0A1Q2L054_9BACL|nr:DUF4181 domain-containing protein [Planococcus lenghuensis]AQQ53272.1 hypothetical protein B0X71_09395 [Planococcus lenghuensis]